MIKDESIKLSENDKLVQYAFCLKRLALSFSPTLWKRRL